MIHINTSGKLRWSLILASLHSQSQSLVFVPYASDKIGIGYSVLKFN